VVKALLKLVIVFVLLAALAVGAVIVYVDQIAASAIERGAGYALGVTTTVDGVRIRPRAGEFSVHGLAVSNPAGFDSPYFLRVASVQLDLPLERLMEDTIHVARIAISDVDVTLLRAKGVSNYDKILENLGRFESDGASKQPEPSAGTQLIIDELLITDVAAKVAVSVLAKATVVDVNVPEIRLKNVGSQSAGVTTAELTNILTKAVLDAIIRSGGVPLDVAKDLKGRLAGLGAVKIELPAGLGSAAEKMLGAAQGADDKAGISNLLGGLLGGKKSE
jgi:hypothetical protein